MTCVDIFQTNVLCKFDISLLILIQFWKELYVVSDLNCVDEFQINAILPLTPLFLPILWRMVNYYGQARVYAAFKVAKEAKVTIFEFCKRMYMCIKSGSIDFLGHQVSLIS
jgi:hypothetical protein